MIVSIGRYYIFLAIIALLLVAMVVVDVNSIIYTRFNFIPLGLLMFLSLPFSYLGLLSRGKFRWETIPYVLFGFMAVYGVAFNLSTHQASGLNSQVLNTVMIGLLLPFSVKIEGFDKIRLLLYIISLEICLISVYFNGFLGLSYMTHERIFLISFIYTLPALIGKRTMAYIGLFLFALVVYLDPRTTSLIALTISVVLVKLFSTVKDNRLTYYVGAASIVIAASFNFVIANIKELNSSFKAVSGGTDNNSFRESMIAIGLEKFAESPLVGSLFKYGGAYPINFTVRLPDGQIASMLPLHNDYLEALVSGGIIGSVLFVACLLVPIFSSFRMRGEMTGELRSMNDSLLIASLIGLIAIAFNPVLNSSRSGFILFVIMSILHLICGHQKKLRDFK